MDDILSLHSLVSYFTRFQHRSPLLAVIPNKNLRRPILNLNYDLSPCSHFHPLPSRRTQFPTPYSSSSIHFWDKAQQQHYVTTKLLFCCCCFHFHNNPPTHREDKKKVVSVTFSHGFCDTKAKKEICWFD